MGHVPSDGKWFGSCRLEPQLSWPANHRPHGHDSSVDLLRKSGPHLLARFDHHLRSAVPVAPRSRLSPGDGRLSSRARRRARWMPRDVRQWYLRRRGGGCAVKPTGGDPCRPGLTLRSVSFRCVIKEGRPPGRSSRCGSTGKGKSTHPFPVRGRPPRARRLDSGAEQATAHRPIGPVSAGGNT